MALANRMIRRALVKKLGALPVIKEFQNRLGIEAIIDRACPVREEVANKTHGQIINLLVANRLTSPRPLYEIVKWAREWAVEEVYGCRPEFLNDDRLGRALDAIYPKIEELKGAITWSAIQNFGLDAAKLHWDITTLAFAGRYEEQDQEAPSIEYGHAKDHPELKQVQAGFGVTEDGGIPLWYQAMDGAAAEVKQVIGAMEGLKAATRQDTFTLVGDTKLVSKENVTAALKAGLTFCAPEPASDKLRQEFLSLDLEEFSRLSYVSERESQKPQDKRTVYLGYERSVTFVVTGKKGKEEYSLRRLFIVSSEEKEACQKHRARQLARAEEELTKLERLAGSKWYPTAKEVEAKAAMILAKRRVKRYYRWQVSTDSAGIPAFHWERDEAALALQEKLDGMYTILTNLPREQYDMSAILALYKNQHHSERRFADFKGPLAVRPLFLKDNKRIAALLFIVYLALLIYCLIEREIRLALAPEGGKMRGLNGNILARPTGRNIFKCFASFAFVLVEDSEGNKFSGPAEPTPVQSRLLALLGMPVSEP